MAQAGFCRYRGSGVEAARQVHVAALSLTGRGWALNPAYKEVVAAQESGQSALTLIALNLQEFGTGVPSSNCREQGQGMAEKNKAGLRACHKSKLA